MIDEAVNVNDLDIEDPIEDNQLPQEEETSKEYVDYSPQADTTDDDYSVDTLTALLQDKGIQDPDHIKFEDEYGQIQDKKWEDLTGEELYNILQSQDSDPERDLDDDEINLINHLRLSNITPEEYAQSLYARGQQSATQPQPLTFLVDDIPDDELYILDLQTRSAGMTDDELTQALDNAKQNPDSYAKLIAGIRQEYRDLELKQIDDAQILNQQQQLAQYQEFTNNILGQIDNLHQIGDLDIDMTDADKNELAQFILGRDGAGVSYLGKALNDNETLTKMAWFALHGEDAFNEIQDYFADLITRARQAGFLQGLAAAGQPQVMIRNNNNAKSIMSTNRHTVDINDLD